MDHPSRLDVVRRRLSSAAIALVTVVTSATASAQVETLSAAPSETESSTDPPGDAASWPGANRDAPPIRGPWRIGVSAAGQVAFDMAERQKTEALGEPDHPTFFGTGAALVLSYSFNRRWELILRASAAPAWSDPGVFLPIVGAPALRYEWSRRTYSGIGVALGYLMTPDVVPVTEGVAEPQSGFTFGPEISPFGIRFGPRDMLDIETRASLYWARQADTAVEVNEPGYFAMQLWATAFLDL